MMMEEDHVKAVSSNTTPITTPKSDPTSETQTIPDSVTKQAFASLGDNQLDKLPLVLQGLAGVIETQPESAHLLLTAISDEAKKPQSISNRGRKYGISHCKYRVGKKKSVNTTPITTPTMPSKATIAFKKRKLQSLLGSIWDAVQETIEIEKLA